MDSSKNGDWIIPFKKFNKLRAKSRKYGFMFLVLVRYRDAALLFCKGLND